MSISAHLPDFDRDASQIFNFHVNYDLQIPCTPLAGDFCNLFLQREASLHDISNSKQFPLNICHSLMYYRLFQTMAFLNYLIFPLRAWNARVVIENQFNPKPSVFDSALSGLGLRPGQGDCVVFLGKTLNSHSASLHTDVQMGTGKLNAGGSPNLASNPGGVEVLLITSCCGNRDKLWPNGTVGSYADITYPPLLYPLLTYMYSCLFLFSNVRALHSP